MKALRLFLWLSFLTGVIYPLFVTMIAETLFYDKANGSLVKIGGEVRGSTLIAQKFTGNSYFWPRPSAVDYNPLPSGGSNLSLTSRALKKAVEERSQRYGKKDTPSELLYASGSGLDPHLTQEAALFQLERVSSSRGIDRQKIEDKIRSVSLVNVLEINLWLDSQHE